MLVPRDIVVAKDDMELLSILQSMEQLESPWMGFLNIDKAPVLPQLIAITHFNIGEAMARVVLQDFEKQLLVVPEGIRAGAIASVDVAEEDEA